VDLVVGLPRSGALAASVIALQLNVNACSAQAYLDDRTLEHGSTRAPKDPAIRFPSDARHVLIVDDAVDTGGSLGAIRPQLERAAASRRQRITFAAVYASPRGRALVDLSFETVAHPRSFEWNLLHRPIVERFCVDLDGVLLPMPDASEITDCEALRRHLETASPRASVSYPIGHLVTALPAAHAALLKAWLRDHRISFGELHHVRQGARGLRGTHADATAKAKLYRQLFDSFLYVTGNSEDARAIAHRSGKSVLAFASQELFSPRTVPAALGHRARSLIRTLRVHLRRHPFTRPARAEQRWRGQTSREASS
jgi:hypothetical protein